MGLFLEGVDSIVAPCTLPILVFSVVFALAGGRHAAVAAVAFIGGASLMAWARFSGLTSLDLAEDQVIAGGLLVAGAAAVTGLASTGKDRRPFVALGAASGGALAAAVWRPCVGAELGTLLTDAPGRGIGALAPMALYVTGLGLVTVALALVPLVAPPAARLVDRRAVRIGAVAVGATLGATLALGLWDGLVDELVRRSTA